MPLPDERPRQSVANLIGRFELQGKRQPSPAAHVVPRSSSVSSQIAGDAAKEDATEKREWPPKSVESVDNKPATVSPSIPSSPSMSKSPALSPQPSIDAPPLADVAPTPTPAHLEPTKSPPPKGKTSTTGKSTPTTGTRRTPMSPAKSRPSAINSPAKSLVRSPPPRTSLQPSASLPLRSQHMGQSVASNASTVRATRTVPKTAPSTPSRPKTPGTQTQGAQRPKTPSTGLSSPTAASLARSRNALPPLPLPTKKVTPSSDAAERLSKPTAASLSKARTPASLALSPARVAKSTSAGATHGVTPRGPSKLRVGLAPTGMKEVRAKEAAKSVAASATSTSSEPSHEPETPADDHAENGHEPEGTVFSDGGVPEDALAHSEVMSDAPHDESALALEEVLSESEVHPEQPVDLRPAKEVTHVEEQVAQGAPEEEVAHGEVRVDVREEEVIPETIESHAEEVVSNGGHHKVELLPAPAGNDIEDIINLLEGTSLSKPRPQSIVSIPDEITDDY